MSPTTDAQLISRPMEAFVISDDAIVFEILSQRDRFRDLLHPLPFADQMIALRDETHPTHILIALRIAGLPGTGDNGLLLYCLPKDSPRGIREADQIWTHIQQNGFLGDIIPLHRDPGLPED